MPCKRLEKCIEEKMIQSKKGGLGFEKGKDRIQESIKSGAEGEWLRSERVGLV